MITYSVCIPLSMITASLCLEMNVHIYRYEGIRGSSSYNNADKIAFHSPGFSEDNLRDQSQRRGGRPQKLARQKIKRLHQSIRQMGRMQNLIRTTQLHPTHPKQPLPRHAQRQPLRLHPNSSAKRQRPKKKDEMQLQEIKVSKICLLYTSPSPRDLSTSRMPSSA